MTQQQIYQMVTDRILETMKQGIIPWHRPWTGVAQEDGGAISYVTRKPYSLLNQMLVGRPGEYLTYKAAKELGGNVKKGEKSSIIVAYDHYYTKETDEKTGRRNWSHTSISAISTSSTSTSAKGSRPRSRRMKKSPSPPRPRSASPPRRSSPATSPAPTTRPSTTTSRRTAHTTP